MESSRLTDEEVIHQSTSPAAIQFCEMLLCALFRSGHIFAQESTGLTDALTGLLNRQGFEQIHTREYTLHYRAGTVEGQMYTQDGLRALRTLRPFIQKWGCSFPDYDMFQQRAIQELSQPDFAATWNLLTAWGTKADYYPQEKLA